MFGNYIEGVGVCNKRKLTVESYWTVAVKRAAMATSETSFSL